MLSGSNEEKLDVIAKVLEKSETGLKGVEELRYIFGVLDRVGIENEVQFDLTLARGLNYYTGAIFEVKSLDVQIGSITGGGRYDNLTGIFGLPGISGANILAGTTWTKNIPFPEGLDSGSTYRASLTYSFDISNQ